MGREDDDNNEALDACRVFLSVLDALKWRTFRTTKARTLKQKIDKPAAIAAMLSTLRTIALSVGPLDGDGDGINVEVRQCFMVVELCDVKSIVCEAVVDINTSKRTSNDPDKVDR